LHLNRFATDGNYPELLFLLQLTPEELKYRLSQKELDGIELRGTEYLLNIQDALIKAAELLKIELVIIDAAQPIETITQTIINKIKESQ
jgi:dTMP kinase